MVFANNRIRVNRFRMCLSKRELFKLPEDSISIFKRNLEDCYIYHPDSVFTKGNFLILIFFCVAEFLRYYYIVSNNEKKNLTTNQKILQMNLWNLTTA